MACWLRVRGRSHHPEAVTTERAFPDIPGQRGLATVPQLLEAGWTRSALRQARATRWQEPMPRVLAPHRGPLDGQARLAAAALWAGPKATVTGTVALSRLGVKCTRLTGVTFVIPEAGRARQHERVRLVRTARELEVVSRSGPATFVGGARALADAAVYEAHGQEELESLTISVLQRGLTTPELLERELWLRPLAAVSSVWKGLEGFVDGAWSRPEVVLREVVDGDGGFPPMVTNCVLVRVDDGEVVGTPDGYIEDAGVVVQVHSRQFHQGIDDQGGDTWARTVEKDGDFVAAGVRVVGVTPWTLYSRPARFVTRLRKIVALGLAGPRPAVRVMPRTADASRSRGPA